MSEKRIFKFNYIIVLESLSGDDKHTGKMLYDDLLRYIPEKISYLDTDFKSVNSEEQFFQEVEAIKHLALLHGKTPFIHIEMHGCPQGLEISSGEIISWECLTEKIREINQITNNNTFLSLATCYSAYIAGYILPSLPVPFFAFIGSWNEIPQGDILANFQRFFEFVFSYPNLKAIDFDKAVERLNDGRQGQPLFSFINSENLFNKIIYDYEKSLADPTVFNTRINEQMAEALKNFDVRQNMSIDQLRLKLWELMTLGRSKTREEMKKTFLMLEQ